MTKPWLVKVGVLFIKKRGCIVLTHPHLIKPLIDVKFDKIMQKECAKTYSSFLKIV